MKTVSLGNAPKVPFDIEGYLMHSSDSLEIIHLRLQPGQKISPHANPFDVVECLVECEVTLFIGEMENMLIL
jgi:hypothetical protein